MGIAESLRKAGDKTYFAQAVFWLDPLFVLAGSWAVWGLMQLLRCSWIDKADQMMRGGCWATAVVNRAGFGGGSKT
jgi:hypothetical protein